MIASLTIERILDLVPAKITVFDSELNYVFVNQPFASALGVDKRALLGTSLGSRQQFHSKVLREKILSMQSRDEFPGECRFEFENAEGEASPHHFYLSRIIQQGATYFVVLSVDVSVQVAMERRLRIQLRNIESLEQYLQTIFDAISDPVFIRSSDQTWLDANQAFFELTGTDKAKLTSSPGFSYLDANQTIIALQAEQAALQASTEIETEEVISIPGSSLRFLSTKRTPKTLADGRQIVIGVIRDISEKKLRDEELQKLSKMRSFSNRLESINEMAHRFGHEINNPLAIIRLRTGSLSDRINRGETLDPNLLKAAFSEIEVASDRIAGLIRAMREIGRPQEDAHPTDLCLVDAVERALPFCIQRSEYNSVRCKFEFTEADRQLLVRSNAAALYQAIVQILNNAYDAIGNRSEGQISIRIEETKHWTSLCIKDNGTGIEEASRPKIFSPFFTTKEPGRSAGLGLSVSRESIRKSGGDIVFRTGPWGTEFEIRLSRGQSGVRRKAG